MAGAEEKGQLEDGTKGYLGAEELHHAMQFDATGYYGDKPSRGLWGVVNDRREHNPVRRSEPYRPK